MKLTKDEIDKRHTKWKNDLYNTLVKTLKADKPDKELKQNCLDILNKYRKMEL